MLTHRDAQVNLSDVRLEPEFVDEFDLDPPTVEIPRETMAVLVAESVAS